MKLYHGNQEVDLFEREIPNQVMLSLSGGLDSASLMFLICKHFPTVEIIPFTGKDETVPFDFQSALSVIQWIKDFFPNAKILKHEWYSFDIWDPEWRKIAEKEWVNQGEGKYTKLSGLTKVLIMDHENKKLFDRYPDALKVVGMTKAPSVEELEKYNFNMSKVENRRIYDYKDPYGEVLYYPYINVDKKFVAGVYKDYDLKGLYNLTSSCVGSKEDTDYFTKPCGKCFWCKEKEWAFEGWGSRSSPN